VTREQLIQGPNSVIYACYIFAYKDRQKVVWAVASHSCNILNRGESLKAKGGNAET
jgi:hypothetical protein